MGRTPLRVLRRLLRRLVEYAVIAFLAMFAAFVIAGCTSDTVALYPCDTKASEAECGYLSDEGWDAVLDAESRLGLEIQVVGDSTRALTVFLTATDGQLAGWHVPLSWRCYAAILSKRDGVTLAHEIGHGLDLGHTCELRPENTCKDRPDQDELRKRVMYPSAPVDFDGAYFTEAERETMRRGAGDLATCP